MTNTKQAVYKRTDCRLCGKSYPEVVLSLEPIPVAGDYVSQQELSNSQDKYCMDVALCNQCGSVFLLDVVDPEILYKNFKYTSSSSPDLSVHFVEYAEYILKSFSVQEEAFVVDIGSNDGLFLRGFQERGLRVLGVDPARDIAKKATESGIETLGVYFDIDSSQKIRSEYGSANIITANNVMANIDNMVDFIQSIRELLDNDGIFIFESGYLLNLVQNMVFDNIYHEHLSYFSVKALEFFFKNNGMELIDINIVNTKGGSLRGVVQLQGASRKRLTSVDKMIKVEKEFGLDDTKVYLNLKERIDLEKKKLLSLIEDLKKKNKTIAGYGASHSVVTFLYYFGIADQLDCLFDDNPDKFNKFSPGHHIPIVSSQEIFERKPDYIIILAWRFYEMIIKKHSKYLENGGHFIVPLSEMKII